MGDAPWEFALLVLANTAVWRAARRKDGSGGR
jgi:hypothetical protein